MKIIYFFDGLGNQMFQYAYYKMLKNKEKKVYANLDAYKRDYNQEIKDFNGYELKRIFKINVEKKKIFMDNFFSRTRWKKLNLITKIVHKILMILKLVIYIENWNESITERINKKRVYFLTGWWQSEKFFKEIEKEIRKDFSFSEFIDKKNKEIEKIILNCNSVSIHIRRGDYLKDKSLGGLAPLKYYQKGIEYINNRVKNPVYFIFSNDINWCKENLKIENEIYYVDWNSGEDSYRDMQLMSLCKHNIIPNSSFSWWGAWLNNNPDKIVIAPEKWFNDCANMDYSNVVPESWIKIKNY